MVGINIGHGNRTGYARGMYGLQGRLLLSLSIAGMITILEVVGGVLSNSLALLGDAAHVGADALSLALATLAMKFATRPHTPTSTYGSHRAEVLAALTNGTTLLIISTYIFYEAYARFLNPPAVRGHLLLPIASIGLIANLAMVLILRKGSEVNINARGAFLHVLGDTLSSLGVIVGGVAILVAELYVLDVIVAAFIGALMLRGAIGITKETVQILLERAPRGIDINKVSDELMKVEGVKSIHDLHIWSITSGMNVLSAHVLVDVHHRDHDVLEKLNLVLKEKFGIQHSTIQIEHPDESTGLVNIDVK